MSSRARHRRGRRRASGRPRRRRGAGMGRKIADGRSASEHRLPSGAERARLVREMFDRIAGRYELLNAVMTAGLHRAWNKKVVEATGLCAGERALDLACGTGSLTRDLARRVGPEGYVLGVDFSKEMLRVAQRRPSSNIEYRLGDATDVAGIEDGSFEAGTK